MSKFNSNNFAIMYKISNYLNTSYVKVQLATEVKQYGQALLFKYTLCQSSTDKVPTLIGGMQHLNTPYVKVQTLKNKQFLFI